MTHIKKFFYYMPHVAFWIFVLFYAFIGFLTFFMDIYYLKGFIEWVGDSRCSPDALAPMMPLAVVFSVVLYAAFQIKKENPAYATLFLLGMLHIGIGLLGFLPYQAYLLRHKNKMMAVLCLVAFAVLVYCKAWYLDFSQWNV